MMRLKSDLVELCEAALDKRLDRVHADWDERAALGVVLAAEGYPDTVRKGDVISGLAAAAKLPGKVFHAATRAEGGQILTSGGRVLGVTANGDSLEEALGRAYEAIAQIHFDGIYYRNDIGHRALKKSR